VSINRNTIIVSREEIFIGKGTSIGPNVCIYDHDHRYNRNGISKKDFVTSPIYIGERCWIGANVIILKGATIGDNCVVGAGTVVRGEIPDCSMVYDKREMLIRQINAWIVNNKG